MKQKVTRVVNSSLWPRLSLVRGFASLIDFLGSDAQEYTERLLARSNAEVIRADWEVVGKSLQVAMDAFGTARKDAVRSE